MNLWFSEDIPIVPGSQLKVQVKGVLYSGKSEFQKIDILDTVTYGRMLILDGVINTSEFDEFAYHEMIAHIPLFAHPNPKTVLVIGGGDGGTVREVVRHKGLTDIHMCELDEQVVVHCKAHLPALANQLDEKRVKVFYQDGYQWVKDHPDTYDVIIVDSTDPVGPAEELFKFPFFEACHNSLKEGGVLVNQAENFYYHNSLIKDLITFGNKLFKHTNYYYTSVPTYPGGLIGFTFFSRGDDPWKNLEKRVNEDKAMLDDLRYWRPEIQHTAFQIPAQFNRKIFGK
jgi:spermidine synthase